jgi:hypothetical protein
MGMANQPLLDSVMNAMKIVKAKQSMYVKFLMKLKNLTSSFVNVKQIKPKQVIELTDD